MTLPVLLDLATRINAEHEAANSTFQAGFLHAIRAGELLIEAKAMLTHGQWLPWLTANCTVAERTAQLYMRLTRERETIEAKSATVADLTIREAAKAITSTHTMGIMGSSASPEWYTPPHVAEMVTEVMGGIDTDPSWHPDSPVKATTTYTQEQDGLKQEWQGRIFLNPTYGREIDGWVAKLVEDFRSGAIDEAIALVPARVDTEWFRRLDEFPRCFIHGRLTFANAENPAPFPSAVVYIGRNVEGFSKVFATLGSIFVKLDTDRLTAAETTADNIASYDAALTAIRNRDRTDDELDLIIR